MKILKFKAKNVKGIRVVELDPDGQDVTLSGANGAGKSSVLDAIVTTLAGGSLPIRRDAEKGEVLIELGPYTITRSITAKTDKVVVKQKDGAALGEPKTLLKKLVGPLAIDPVAFCVMKPRDQVDLLFGLLPGLRPALKAIDDKIEGYKATRAAINAELGRQATFPEEDPDLPEERIDCDDLNKRKLKALRHKDIVQQTENTRTRLQEQIEEQKTVVAAAQQKLQELAQELDALPEYEQTAKELQAQFRSLEQEAQRAVAVNERITERDRIRALKEVHATKRVEYNDLLGDMKAAEAEKSTVLSEAKLPLKGLSVDESGVYFRGVPVADLSTSERVRVGAAIAVAQNPTAKIILADDASLLDSKSLAVLRETCRGFQIWTVVNDESGKAGVWIEDGSVHQDDE
jgi:chromosome condensin MukBEF ATPase and DNA-binding subunit MukB